MKKYSIHIGTDADTSGWPNDCQPEMKNRKEKSEPVKMALEKRKKGVFHKTSLLSNLIRFGSILEK